MRLHSQNLNTDRRDDPIGSRFWRGRAWLYSSRGRYDELLHWEWHFWKYARDFAITMNVGYGDSDAGVCFHVCIPWLFSLFLVFPHVRRCRESKTGIGIHNGGFWIYPFTDEMESSSNDPWWKKAHCFRFPWDYNWHSTEILKPAFGIDSEDWQVVWKEQRGDRKKKDAFDVMRDKDVFKKQVSEIHTYSYKLKRGEVQTRGATIFVERMTWRMRWFPLLPFQKVRTSIDVSFDGEVGEGTGSWKGGTVGCGYDMLPGEMPVDTLRRMERERTFDR